MKVNIKSVLKTSAHDFQCFQDEQIIFPSGNMLCVKQINKGESQFICLNKHIQHLYSFKPSNNRKGVFTAEKLQNTIEIAYYNLKAQRKSISFTQQVPSFTEIQRMQLLVDQYQNHLVYGWAQNREGCCIFLCDINKTRILAHGFVTHFEDIKIDIRQNMSISLCGFNGNYNYRKCLKYELGQWEISEHLYKKMHGTAITHQLLYGQRVLLATKRTIYIFQEMQVLQQIELPESQQVDSIVKLPKAFLIVTGGRIKAYVQDHQEATFIEKSFIPLELELDDEIFKIQASHNNESIVVRTIKNNLYTWKTQCIELDPTHPEMKFLKVETGCSGQSEGTLSVSTDKHYCALADKKVVTLWSLQNNEVVLSSQFGISQKKKQIITCAINPDGNSIIVSFEDRIRVYKILLNKFYFHKELFMKHCEKIIYSHSGQIAACKHGTSIEILNLVQMSSVSIIKPYTQPLQIIWSELDDQLIVSGQNHTIQIFKTNENIRLYNVHIDSPIQFVRFDFISKKLLVSTENKVLLVQNEEIVEEIIPNVMDFHYMYPLFGLYFIVSKRGALYYSSSITFQHYHQYSLFTNSPFQLICRANLLIAYSSFQDVVILECVGQNDKPIEREGEIVMVEKEQIQSLFTKVKQLQTSFDMLINSTNVKLEEERQSYEAAIMQFQSKLGNQINFVQSKFNQISNSKIQQEKQTQKMFQVVQANQVMGLNNLQNMFVRKLSLQKEKSMNLSQAFEQQKFKYDQIVFDLQAKYHRQVKEIRNNYSCKMKEEFGKAEVAKLNSLRDKERIQIKLLDLQQQNQLVTTQIQQDSNITVARLHAKIHLLEEQYNYLLLKYRNQEEMWSQVQQQQYKRDYEHRKLTAILEQTNNRLQVKEKDIACKIEIIKEKQERIHFLQHQIKELQKAKHVLNFQSTQVLKEIQPKQALIEKLKCQIMKADGELKEEKKRIVQLSHKIEKLQKMNELGRKQNNEMKYKLSERQKLFDDLCWEIYMIVHNSNQKQWAGSLVKVYQLYVKEYKFEDKHRKKDETSKQINRHLMHAEQSLLQMSSANSKSLKRKEDEITKKMEQNSTLLYELNIMRKNQKNYEKQKKQMSLIIQRLRRDFKEIQQSNEMSARNNTARSGMTKKFTLSKNHIMSQQKSTIIDTSDYDKQIRDIKTRNKIRRRMSSAHKTLMLKNEMKEPDNKFAEIAKEFQSFRNTIKYQNNMQAQH